MADTLRRMLESGLLTKEQCLSVLSELDSDEEAKVVGGCKSEKAIQGTNMEEAVIRPDNRKSLLQLLDIRKPSSSERQLICHQLDHLMDIEDGDVGDVYYFRQFDESQGFDFDPGVRIPRIQGFSPFYFGENEQPPTEMVLYGRLGVHWFNFENNKNLEFIRIPKLNTEHPFSVSYFITVEVKDVDAGDSLTLQTMVRRPDFPELGVLMQRCRIKPTIKEEDGMYPYFNFFHRLDGFYLGRMPAFLSEPPEADDTLRFYKVQGVEDFDKNHWLHLYTEFALFQVCEAGSHSFLPDKIEIKKILVETLETHTEPSLKLKSMNAIFHISFRANGCDYTSVMGFQDICSSKSIAAKKPEIASLHKFLNESGV